RIHAADRLTAGLSGLKGLRVPVVKPDSTHVYYSYPMILDLKALGLPRAKLVEALRAEGIPGVGQGYQNVHRLPMFQKKIAYGKKGFPWSADSYQGDVSYRKGICPVAEELHDVTMIGLGFCMHHYSDQEVDQVVRAFRKVWANLDQLA
ncbi:MAG: DegT/DnrJ/EryC1/StrS family aminotransferase, partial [Bdellovibrionota bacterium]